MGNVEVFVLLSISFVCMIASNILFYKKQNFFSTVTAALSLGFMFGSTLSAISTNNPHLLGLISVIIALFVGWFAVLWPRGYKIATTTYYITTIMFLIVLL